MGKHKKIKKSGNKDSNQNFKRSSDKFSVEGYKNRIVTFVQKSGKKPVSPKELAAKCRSIKGNEANFNLALNELIAQFFKGIINKIGAKHIQDKL